MELIELEAEVGIEVPGAARFAVMNAISAAAREFFIDSRSWREEFGPLALAEEVVPTVPADTFLVEAVSVSIDENQLRSGEFAMTHNGGIVFVGNRHGNVVTGVIAVAPTGLREEIPDRLGNEFRDGLVHGALSRLMRIPDAEWSNERHALYHLELFEMAKDRAATRAEDGFTKKRTRIVRYGGY